MATRVRLETCATPGCRRQRVGDGVFCEVCEDPQAPSPRRARIAARRCLRSVLTTGIVPSLCGCPSSRAPLRSILADEGRSVGPNAHSGSPAARKARSYNARKASFL